MTIRFTDYGRQGDREAHLDGVLATTASGVNVGNRELLEHLASRQSANVQDFSSTILTFPVLVMLWVTFSSLSESLGRTLGIEPPVACLHDAAISSETRIDATRRD